VQRSFVILEKSDRVGGTWRDNSYPGCSCDVASRFYWYSFDKQPDWTRAFAFQPEILGHIEEMVERQLRRGLQESAFVTGCNSCYRTKEGRLVTNWWGNVEPYKARTAQLNPADFELLSAD